MLQIRLARFLPNGKVCLLMRQIRASRPSMSIRAISESRISTLLLNDSFTRFAAAQFAHLGLTLRTVPFSAVIYRTGNSDSIEGGIRLRMDANTDSANAYWPHSQDEVDHQGLRKEFMLVEC